MIRVPGHASCSVRTTGSAWQTSPSAESRSTQILSGGGVEQWWLHAREMVGSGDPMVNNPCRTRQER